MSWRSILLIILHMFFHSYSRRRYHNLPQISFHSENQDPNKIIQFIQIIHYYFIAFHLSGWCPEINTTMNINGILIHHTIQPNQPAQRFNLIY